MSLISGLQLNPKLPQDTRSTFSDLYEKYRHQFSPENLWLATSGTTSNTAAGRSGSLIVLSHDALEVSARAVNAHLQVSSQDRWGLALPLFHIGGLMVLIRAALGGIAVSRFDESWDVRSFHRWLGDARVTLLSLVPTQVFDLVEAGLKAPRGLRAVVVGGARLEPELFRRARDLDWPLLKSYGMTECGSQIATGTFVEPDVLRPLSHVEVRSSDGILELRSRALMSAKIEVSGTIIRLTDGEWFQTSDRGEVIDIAGQPALKIHGRVGDVVKILGELVDVARLNDILHSVLAETAANRIGRGLKLKTESDLRTGASLTLLYGRDLGLSESEVDGLVARYNERVAPFERVTSRREVDEATLHTWKESRVDRYS